ncbi:MAG: hypothetical protein EXR09_09045 [Acetobacteraceae bacterium]|nr:hypothetical protein [Acetobacteraceae bacterium]
MFRVATMISFLGMAPVGPVALTGFAAPPPVEPSGILLRLNDISIQLIQRALFDAVWSLVIGRDCSVVY